MLDIKDEMLGRDASKHILDYALHHSKADQTEVVLSHERGSLTRFTNNAIHQSVVTETPSITVRAVFGTRVGVASATCFNHADIAHTVEQAETIARLVPENEDLRGLPAPQGEIKEAVFSSNTMRCNPDVSASMVELACRLAHKAGLKASGLVTTAGQEIAVANSLGVFSYTPRSTARVVVVTMGENGSGYAQDNAIDIAALNMEILVTHSIKTAQRAQHPIALPPGDYTVILQPEAVSDIARFLALRGFGAQAVCEGRSFVTHKRGELVLGENITIWDDGRDPAGLPLPFDYEGIPRQRLCLIRQGVAKDIALDTFYANKMKTSTTGHAMPLVNDLFDAGPIPLNLCIAPGTETIDQMISSTKYGLLISRFHYTRVVHPLHITITGMTRDGTFLIENGEVTHAVKNLRYVQSYIAALRNVQAISQETRLVGESLIARVPALKIGQFTFTGCTQ